MWAPGIPPQGRSIFLLGKALVLFPAIGFVLNQAYSAQSGLPTGTSTPGAPNYPKEGPWPESSGIQTPHYSVPNLVCLRRGALQEPSQTWVKVDRGLAEVCSFGSPCSVTVSLPGAPRRPPVLWDPLPPPPNLPPTRIENQHNVVSPLNNSRGVGLPQIIL